MKANVQNITNLKSQISVFFYLTNENNSKVVDEAVFEL